MAVAVASSSNTAFASASSTVVTKPTGLATNDLMYATIVYVETGTAITFTTPAGWTLGAKTEGKQIPTAGYSGIATFYKIADAGDVAAANFTFSVSATGIISGTILRITGGLTSATVATVETDESTANSATVAFTATATPTSKNALVITSVGCYDIALGANVSFSAETITPSGTATEQVDVNYKTGTNGGGYAVSTFPITSLTQITAYGATISESVQVHLGTIGIVIGAYNETGTNALLNVSPTIFTDAGVTVGGTGTSALLSVSPTIPTQSGTATTTTQWINESVETTTWTNESL